MLGIPTQRLELQHLRHHAVLFRLHKPPDIEAEKVGKRGECDEDGKMVNEMLPLTRTSGDEGIGENAGRNKRAGGSTHPLYQIKGPLFPLHVVPILRP